MCWVSPLKYVFRQGKYRTVYLMRKRAMRKSGSYLQGRTNDGAYYAEVSVSVGRTHIWHPAWTNLPHMFR